MTDREQLVALGEPGARTPVFCMHPIGGHAGDYVALAALIDRAHPRYAIRSRACLAPESEHATIEAMAAEYASLVQATHDQPCVLLGWSMGALTAHAVACELERRGAPVALVAMIDPVVGGAADDDLRTAVTMAIRIFHPSPPPRPIVRRKLAELPARDEVVAWCIANALLPEDSPRDLVEGAIGLYPRHRALVAAHRPGRCRTPLQVWRARTSPAHDWAAHTAATCTVRTLTADHFTIVQVPHVEAIAGDLNSTLAALA